jgi:hypothetical protein
MNDVKVLTDLKGEPAFVQWVHALTEAFGICIKKRNGPRLLEHACQPP